jgi:penicillin amidase
MKKVRFIITLILTISLIVALNSSIKGLPALGSLLNPTSGFWQNAEDEKFYLPESLVVENLKEKVAVYFDAKRIPHIFAENEHDLYFVQGYIVASLRLWQMEFQVLAAEGRISEILGNEEKYINFDKNQRRLGLTYGATNKLKAIKGDKLANDLLNAYTEGVNAYISELKTKDLPVEYKLMGYEPELWTNQKTMLVIMNMSKILGNTGNDIENSNFVAKYGKELFDKIYQTDLKIEPVIPTPHNGWKNEKNDLLPIIENEADSIIKNTADVKLTKVKDEQIYHVGSNNWAVSGSKTKSGYPLLSNDPHLAFSLPSVWIEMHLVGPQSNAYGVTFPGAPGITIGFNESIGWGMTNSGRDVKDFYTIEYKDATKELYHYQDQWLRSEFKYEEIKVKGAPSVFDTVIYTKFGPVAYTDFQTQNGKKDIAIQWMPHRGSKEYLMFYKLNKAQNFEEYKEATRHFESPSQNMVFACVDGDIALRNQGNFPINEHEQSLFLQTSNEGKVWDNFIPFDENPMQHNPKRGFVSSANQESTDSNYPYYYTGWFEHYRNRVLNNELEKISEATVADMKALQMNNFNLIAFEALPLMLPYLDKEDFDFNHQDIYNALNKWDCQNVNESKESIYFEVFFQQYKKLLWDEFGDGLATPNIIQTLTLLEDSTKHLFIDNKTTKEIETQKDLITQAFNFSVESYENGEAKTWGKYNEVNFAHVAKLDAFSRKIETSGGNNHVINATRGKFGPSWRMILDFDGGKINGIGVFPGGESGNPGSPFYDNFVDDWASEKYHRLENNDDKAFYEKAIFNKVLFLGK